MINIGFVFQNIHRSLKFDCVQKILSTDWLFLLLLTGSAVGHVAVGDLGDEQTAVSLDSMQEGESSISVQLIARTRPADSHQQPIELPIRETESSVERLVPAEVPPSEFLDTPPQQPAQENFETIRQDSTTSVLKPQESAVDLERANQVPSSETELQVERPTNIDSNNMQNSYKSVTINLPQADTQNAPIIIPPEGSLTPRIEQAPVLRRSDSEQMSAVSERKVIRQQQPMEFEPDAVVADTPPKKGNASSDVVVKESTGANSAPSLDRKNPLNRPPVFPPELIDQGVSGTVKLVVEVLPNGKVGTTKIAISTGSEELDQVAQQAVARWQFTPGFTNGVAVTKRVLVPITFKIEKRRAGVLKR